MHYQIPRYRDPGLEVMVVGDNAYSFQYNFTIIEKFGIKPWVLACKHKHFSEKLLYVDFSQLLYGHMENVPLRWYFIYDFYSQTLHKERERKKLHLL